MASYQAPLSLGFSRQEHWSGLPFPSPMHEREKWKWSRSVVSDSATPWTAAYQAPPSMGFSRQEYWNGVPLPSPRILWGTSIIFSLMVVPIYNPQRVHKSSLFSTSSPKLGFSSLYTRHFPSDRCEVTSHSGLDCISPMISNAEHLFMCACWPSVCILWTNVCAGPLPNFWLNFFWVVWVFLIYFEYWSLNSQNLCKYFLPFSRLLFICF